jgi:toxin ParE1/3/4
LIDCFTLLANNPLPGRAADAVHPGLRRHEHGSHVVFYEPESTGIAVIAIVHGSAVRLLRL